MADNQQEEIKDPDFTDEEELEVFLEEAIDSEDSEKLSEIIDQVYPIDLALAMEDYNHENLSYIIDNTDNETLASIIEQADEDLTQTMVELIDIERLIKIFEYMSKDDIADIVGDMKVLQRKRTINLMKAGDRKTIESLLGYEEGTAGSIMTTEYISININKNIKEVIDKIKEIGPKTEVIDIIFGVNNKGELVGYADLRDILIAPKNFFLEQIIDDNVISVSPETDQEEVALLVSKYDLNVIPVISNKKTILGIITVDDIIDVINEEHTEDMLYMGGANAEEEITSPIKTSIKMRLPWLIINLFTAFAAAFVVSQFESTIAKVTALAAAMPIVTGMGGNGASQQQAIMIRAIALGEVELKDGLPLVLKQIGVGLINGAVTGFLAGLVLYFMYKNAYLGLIIFLSMILNLIVGSLAGVIIPLVLKSLKIDPALASSIFITTVTDMFGFFIFLTLASSLITKLI